MEPVPLARSRVVIAAPVESKKLVTTQELADYLDLSPQTVRLWRVKGYGPPFLKMGKHVRYRWSDVEKWETSELRQATA